MGIQRKGWINMIKDGTRIPIATKSTKLEKKYQDVAIKSSIGGLQPILIVQLIPARGSP